MRSCIACANRRLDLRCSTQTYRRPALNLLPVSTLRLLLYAFHAPLKVGGWVGLNTQVSNFLRVACSDRIEDRTGDVWYSSLLLPRQLCRQLHIVVSIMFFFSRLGCGLVVSLRWVRRRRADFWVTVDAPPPEIGSVGAAHPEELEPTVILAVVVEWIQSSCRHLT